MAIIHPSVDALIYSAAATTNYGTNIWLTGGSTTASTTRWRSLIAIPIGDIGSGDSVLFYAYAHTLSTAAAGTTQTIYPVRRADWAEAQATWNIFKTGSNWTSAGCSDTENDYDDSLSATATAPAVAGWVAFDISALVTAAKDAGLTVLHIRLSGDESKANTRVAYWSSDYTDNTTLRPYVLARYSIPQERPRYIYDDRFTVMWNESADDATQYGVYVGTPGFTPGAPTLKTTIDAGTGYFTVTGLSASTEYECIIRPVGSTVHIDSARKHVTTTEANAVAIAQDGDFYMPQAYFSQFTALDVDYTCIGIKPQGSHTGGTAAGYALDIRSDGSVRHFNYIENALADVTWPGVSGYYRTLIKPSGATYPIGFPLRVADASGNAHAHATTSTDARGFAWAETVAWTDINAAYDDVYHVENGRPIELSDGSVLAAFYTNDSSGNFDARIARKASDGSVFADYGLIYLGLTIASVQGAEPVLAKLSGTYPNETIVCLFRPNKSNVDSAPYISVSTNSGATWGAAALCDMATPSGNNYLGYSPPDIYYDADADRLWCVIGHRWGNNGSRDANDGVWLFYTDTPTANTGWSAGTRVATSTAAYSRSEIGHGTIVGVDSELWIGFTECVGEAISGSGTSNPYVGFKAFTKTDTPSAQALTKYTPATEPYVTPAAPTITATADTNSILTEWADVAADVGYLIQRKDAGAYADLDSVAAGSTSYDDTTATPGVTYTYRVKALGLFDDGPYSNEATATARLPRGSHLLMSGLHDGLHGGLM